MIQETPAWVREFGHEFIIVCFVLVALGLTLICGALLLDKCKRSYAIYLYRKSSKEPQQDQAMQTAIRDITGITTLGKGSVSSREQARRPIETDTHLREKFAELELLDPEAASQLRSSMITLVDAAIKAKRKINISTTSGRTSCKTQNLSAVPKSN